MLVPRQIGFLRFILHFIFCSVTKLFSLLKVGLNYHFKPTVSIGFSSILLNIALFLDLAFFILLPSVSASRRKSTLRSIYGFENVYYLNCNNLCILKF